MFSDHISSLKALIMRIEQSIGAYIWASENSANPATTARFLNCVNQREHALKRLKDAVARIEDNSGYEVGADKGEVNHFIDFRAAFIKSDQETIEAEIRREDEALVNAFHSLMDSDVDESVMAALHQSLEIIKQSSIRLSADV